MAEINNLIGVNAKESYAKIDNATNVIKQTVDAASTRARNYFTADLPILTGRDGIEVGQQDILLKR
jgi:hypothetical protein